jgi:putative methanogenesis marker protein 6
MADRVTRIIVLAENSDLTPGQLATLAYSLSEPVDLKETCFGLMVQGERESVKKVLEKIRAKAPYSVFSKERGFCIGERKKCRLGKEGGISGAPRVGFHQLEMESHMLTIIGQAIEAVERNEENGAIQGKPKRLDEDSLLEAVRQILSEC